MRRFALAAALVATLLPAAASAAPKTGDAAPGFTLPTLAGKPLALASLKGKAVYLNFFASWCGPCNEEAPAIGKLSVKYKPKGLAVVGIDELESAEKAGGFMRHFHLPYTAVIDGDGKTGRDYGALGLPVHVFIDRNGIVRAYRLGEMTPQAIESAIQGIL